jgi:DNA-binding NarL/FixJ family response regulator
MNDVSSKIRVLIIEDHTVVRKGLQRLLQDLPDIEVIGDTEFGEEGVQIVQEQAPDVVLLDLRLETSQITGMETLAKIVASSPSTHVVVLTVVSDEAAVVPAIRAGAIGYMTKNSSPAQVIEAIRDAAHGRYHLDPLITQKIVEHLQGEARLAGDSSVEPLTPREQELLPLISKGMTNQEIAKQLVISPATVKTHVSNILRKLKVSNRTKIPLRIAHYR